MNTPWKLEFTGIPAVSPKEAIAMLGVSRRSLNRMINRGDLAAHTMPNGRLRVHVPSIEAYLNKLGKVTVPADDKPCSCEMCRGLPATRETRCTCIECEAGHA